MTTQPYVIPDGVVGLKFAIKDKEKLTAARPLPKTSMLSDGEFEIHFYRASKAVIDNVKTLGPALLGLEIDGALCEVLPPGTTIQTKEPT